MTQEGEHSSDQQQEQQQPPPNQDQEVLQLPPVDPNAAPDDMPTLDLASGGSIKLESLGPIILNTDGTTRRISNWDQLSPHEQEVSWRRIRTRNEQRRKILEEQAAAAQGPTDSNGEGNEL
jgi:hypothetical protein